MSSGRLKSPAPPVSLTLTSETFTGGAHPEVKVFFLSGIAGYQNSGTVGYWEIMKNTLFHIAVVCMLILAGFTPAQSACNDAAGAAYSQRCSELSCCAKNPADAGEPYRDAGSSVPASGESSCDYCQFSSDAAVSTASAVSDPCNLFGGHSTVEHLPLLAGHTLPLIKPPHL